MKIYADSSFLTSIYLLDVHTQEAVRRLAARPEIWLTPFHEAEIAHAISQSVFRGSISARQANLAVRNLARDSDAGLWLQTDFPPAAYATAIQLARRYGARIGSRTLDSLHVACALELHATRFWTFDTRQAKLAKAAGLRTS
jgi:predicted nucleic acid-binding protein